MTLYLSNSRPRKAFKSLLGNANHLIITALVGLDAVERGCVYGAPAELRTVWSPKDAAASAKRSRRLLLDMSLIRAIDAIDVYLNHAVRKPTLIQCPKLRSNLDSAGISIFKKLRAVEDNCHSIDVLPLAIIFLMVSWRNRSAHSEADTEVQDKHLSVLKNESNEISERFSGLSSTMLLEGYENVRPVTFKEVASLINSAHHFIADLDEKLLRDLDVGRYAKECVWISLGSKSRPGETTEQARKRRAVSIWGKDPSNRGDAVVALLRQLGFSSVAPKDGFYSTLSENLVKELANFTPQEVLSWAREGVDRT